MTLPDKERVLSALIAEVSATQQQAAQHAEGIRRDATHEEARPENDKDTRALEQTYLARGQALRAEAMVEQLALLRTLDLAPLRSGERIRAGTLVRVEDEHGERTFFVSPCGGGTHLEVDGCSVQVITPVSAIGRALLGKREGDEVEVRVPTGMRDYTVIAAR